MNGVRHDLSAVDLSSVADVDHQDQKMVIVDLVENAVVTDPNAPGISPTEFLNSMRSGIIRQAADGIGNPLSVLRCDS